MSVTLPPGRFPKALAHFPSLPGQACGLRVMESSTSSGNAPTSARRWLLRVIWVLAVGCAFLLLLPYLLTPLYRVVDPVSTLMLWRWATRARVERVVTPIDLAGPALPRAVLTAEDARFC